MGFVICSENRVRAPTKTTLANNRLRSRVAYDSYGMTICMYMNKTASINIEMDYSTPDPTHPLPNPFTCNFLFVLPIALDNNE